MIKKIKEIIQRISESIIKNKVMKVIAIVLMSLYQIVFSFYMVTKFNINDYEKGTQELLGALVFGLFLWLLAFIFKLSKSQKHEL